MSLWRQLTHGLRVLTRRGAADDDLDEELRSFADLAADELQAAGLSRAESERAVRREIGDAVRVRERVREGGWEHGVETLVADLRLAGRMLRKSLLFSAVVVLVVALGAGAVTTVFSAMNALLLRPLPGVSGADRLVSVQPARRDGTSEPQASHPLYVYLRLRSRR